MSGRQKPSRRRYTAEFEEQPVKRMLWVASHGDGGVGVGGWRRADSQRAGAPSSAIRAWGVGRGAGGSECATRATVGQREEDRLKKTI
ncbi:hypothetical protein MCA1568 [Methylococcus capsulatus str. Bath]|uniref:Uncharacterized protein n=1 Tax=Methylococcus capsulatus (strain ATCC 33009 / NCIMB 11132 / Bath) TaxID=243233 RepID=Q608C7_METCA|nr:hypothetical protein MCA1568 [Methylococcus capsulatus str. Bath]